LVENCNGLQRIESLVNHPSAPIYEKARSLINQYFNNDEEVTDASGSEFSFGTAPSGGFSF